LAGDDSALRIKGIFAYRSHGFIRETEKARFDNNRSKLCRSVGLLAAYRYGRALEKRRVRLQLFWE